MFHTAPPKKCKAKADVAFLLDSSGSIRRHYRDEKNFLKALAGAFDLNKGGSQAGVITFSQRTEISIKLNQYHDIDSFNKVSEKKNIQSYLNCSDLVVELIGTRDSLCGGGGKGGLVRKPFICEKPNSNAEISYCQMRTSNRRSSRKIC